LEDVNNQLSKVGSPELDDAVFLLVLVIGSEKKDPSEDEQTH
jgi:hypothetical protein